MRKLIVGLMVGSLLAVAGPAMAQQQGGIGDPLTLAASGVLIPWAGAAGDSFLLEVASPVNDSPRLHMFFFNAACSRVGDSVGLPLTVNDIAFLSIPTVTSEIAGLVTIGSVDTSGFNLLPLEAPIHTRMYLFNPTSGKSRVVSPIILDTAEFAGNPHTWSPLRTAATFYAPRETATVTTNLFFICPNNAIQATTGTASAFPIASGFPAIAPPFPTTFPSDMLRARIYDTNEVFLRDVKTGCSCVRQANVTAISNIYSDATVSAGTYTEIEANPANAAGDFAFTGYRSSATVGSAINDFFERLSNGSRPSIQGVNGVVTNAR